MSFMTVILSKTKDLPHFFSSRRCRFLASLGMTREGTGSDIDRLMEFYGHHIG